MPTLWRIREERMAHTHEFDCVVCGAHFDSQDDLAQHDRKSHAPKQAIDIHAPAEPMGNEHPRRQRDGERGTDRGGMS